MSLAAIGFSVASTASFGGDPVLGMPSSHSKMPVLPETTVTTPAGGTAEFGDTCFASIAAECGNAP